MDIIIFVVFSAICLLVSLLVSPPYKACYEASWYKHINIQYSYTVQNINKRVSVIDQKTEMLFMNTNKLAGHCVRPSVTNRFKELAKNLSRSFPVADASEGVPEVHAARHRVQDSEAVVVHHVSSAGGHAAGQVQAPAPWPQPLLRYHGGGGEGHGGWRPCTTDTGAGGPCLPRRAAAVPPTGGGALQCGREAGRPGAGSWLHPHARGECRATPALVEPFCTDLMM